MTTPAHLDGGDDTGVGPERDPTASTPRWVKVFGMIALVVVLLFVILIVTGRGGGHGPGRHSSPGDPTAIHRPPA